MKKKHRMIIVNDIKYVWIATATGDGDNKLRIFRNKKEVYGTIIDGAITPKMIAEIIGDHDGFEK